MCQVVIGVALCAPAQKPAVSSACSDLHLIASKRHVCCDAKGSCLCFFGTCGKIQNVVSSDGFDLTTLQKVRCAACIAHDDDAVNGNHGRELIESPLLTRQAVPEQELSGYMSTLKYLWGNKNACPYHKGEINNGQQGATEKDINGDNESSSMESAEMDGLNEAKAVQVHELSTKSEPEHHELPTTEAVNVFANNDCDHIELAAVMDENHTITNKHRNNEVSTVQVTSDGGEEVTELSSGSGKEIDDPNTVGIESSRWAPDTNLEANSETGLSNPAREFFKNAPRAPSMTIDKVAGMKEFLRMA